MDESDKSPSFTPEGSAEKDKIAEGTQASLRDILGDDFSPAKGSGGGEVNNSDFYMRAVLGFPCGI